MTGGRDSAFGLNVSLPTGSGLILGEGTAPGDRYVFTGGTTVTGGGYLNVTLSNTLVSNVTVDGFSSLFADGNIEGNIVVQPTFTPDLDNGLFLQGPSVVRGNLDNGGFAVLYSQLIGNVSNTGELRFAGQVTGDLTNSGRMSVAGFSVQAGTFGTINGNFTQTADGTFAFELTPNDPSFQAGPMQVTGQARLDGTLELSAYQDDWGPYPLPGAVAHHLLHANGGVIGQFARWTSPGLFLEGNVRYGPNDAWFDVTRIALQAMMAANAAAPEILASASNLDRAFDRFDAIAGASPSSLEGAQRQFLTSAGAVLSIDNVAQASRTLDSLSGRSFTDLHGGLLDSFDHFAPQWMQLQQWRDEPGARHAWTAATAPSTGNRRPAMMHRRLSESGVVSGANYRLGPQFLLGTAMASGDAWMTHEGNGWAHAEESLAVIYGHAWRGPWHAYGELRAGRGQVGSWRQIDLDDRRVHRAGARFDITQLSARLEGGFEQAVGRGLLTSFAALQHDTVHTGAFTEMGDTGLELIGQDASSRRTSAEFGLRYLRKWQRPTGWLRLAATGAHRHVLRADGGMVAAFTGVPDVMFRIDDAPRDSDVSWLDLQLEAGHGVWWSSHLGYRFTVDDAASDRGWWMGIERRF